MSAPLPTPSPANLPHDPDLEPVPAAKAAMAAEAAQGGVAAQDDGADVVPVPQAGSRPRPVITPARPEDWSTEVPLQYPLVVDGVLVDRLVLRRITAGTLTNIIMADDNEESINRRARAAIAGLDVDVFDSLDADDAVVVASALRPFLPRALRGAESLEMDLLAVAAEPDGEQA